MPVRPYRRTNRSALPRVNLQARRVTQNFLDNGYPTENTFTDFTLESCTVQPAGGEELETLGEGYKDLEAYNIFTRTDAKPAVEGTDSNPDEVFLSSRYASNPGFFLVMRRKAWQNQVVPHYHLLVVRKNDR